MLSGGTNIRELLVDNGINVYRSVTRWTNCKGKQRCGTCIVDVRNTSQTPLYIILLIQKCFAIQNVAVIATTSLHCCLPQVLKNPEACTRKSLNENAALLENPESYRLSCITSVYEDVTLEVQGPVGEAASLKLTRA